MIVFSHFCAVGVRIKMASLLRLRSGRREWRGRRRDDLTQLTYEEHRTLSKVLHESLKTFKATLDYAEMDEESSMSDSDLSDESADTALSKLRQSQNEKLRVGLFNNGGAAVAKVLGIDPFGVDGTI
ncbi:hypothetical protein T05_7950, partial [Trichinella murrelli]